MYLDVAELHTDICRAATQNKNNLSLCFFLIRICNIYYLQLRKLHSEIHTVTRRLK